MSAFIYKVIVRGKVFGEATTLAEAEAAAKKHGGKVLQEMGKTSNPGAASGERVGDIILSQLGGTNRLKAMINANNFLIHPDGVEFSFSGPEPQKRGNNVLIRLEPGDTYSAGFIYMPKTSRHWATAIPSRPIHKYTGIYADQLMPLLERHTGMAWSLGSAFNSPKTSNPRASGLSLATKQAIQAYGIDACRKAFDMHDRLGYGASGIVQEGPVTIRTTRQADAAINAGRELAGAEAVKDKTSNPRASDPYHVAIGRRLIQLPGAKVKFFAQYETPKLLNDDDPVFEDCELSDPRASVFTHAIVGNFRGQDEDDQSTYNAETYGEETRTLEAQRKLVAERFGALAPDRVANPARRRSSNPPLEHSNAAILLDTVKPGKPQVIHGVKVSRVGAGYSIDRVVLSRELAIKRLEQGGKTANPKAKPAAKVQSYGPKAGAVEPVLPPSTKANFFAFASAVAKATKSKMVRSPTFFVYVPDFGAFHDSAMMGKKTNDGQTLWVLEAWLEPTGNARAPFVFSIAVLARDSRSLKEDPDNGVQIYAVSGNLTERTFSPALVAKIASHVEKWAANTDHPTPLGADGFPVSPAYRQSNPKAKKPAGPVVYI